MVMSRLVVGNPVDGRDGPLGTVAGTRAATDGLPQDYVLVRLPQVFGLRHTTRLVPLAWVRSAPPNAPRVTLDASRAEVVGCPPLRTDGQILADVAQALSEAVGVFDAPTMRATVQEGVVTLTGHTPHLRARRTAVSRAWDVPGVLEVLDHSVYDGELIVAVAQALLHDPDTRAAHLLVTSRMGEVGLSGTLPSDAARQQASALALAVPGVTGVHNGVTIKAARPVA